MSSGNPIQLATAEHIASNWLEKFREYCDSKAQIHICGSIRRKATMVRDIDILIICGEESHGVFQRGTKFEGVELNLCFLKEECLGSGLLFLTGDADFNIRLRFEAKKQSMLLNRYGLWCGGTLVHSKTEEGIFKALGLAFIQPEHRGNFEGQKGIRVKSSSSAADYEVFVEKVHGFNFCNCSGFRYRGACRHLTAVEV